MDSDFRKTNQTGDTPTPRTDPITTPPRSSWQNDVISALHGPSGHKPPEHVAQADQTQTGQVITPRQAEHVAVKIDDAPTGEAGHLSVQPPSEAEMAAVPVAADTTQPQDTFPEPSSVFPSVSSYVSPGNPTGFSDATLPPPTDTAEVMPIAVVQVVSTRGVEYAMLTLALWLGAISLLGVLLSLINGGTSAEVLAFPASVLVVCLPVFSFFFLRLKKAELQNPDLKVDPSKRRLTQFTQLIAFAVCLFTIIAFVYFIFTKFSGTSGTSVMKAILDVLAVLVVAGGILAYYWFDEHKSRSGR